MVKVVLASNNPGKIREFRELLDNFHLTIIPQAELGVEEVEETGLSFIENALIKARHASLITGLPAIADDSGLAVDALNGAPGIYSARFAGNKMGDEENNKKLLRELEHVPDEKRSACFHCVLVYMSHANDPVPLVCDAKWPGVILREMRGTGGFGYNPVFYVPSEKMTAAEMSSERKNTISHRGLALKALVQLLPEKL